MAEARFQGCSSSRGGSCCQQEGYRRKGVQAIIYVSSFQLREVALLMSSIPIDCIASNGESMVRLLFFLDADVANVQRGKVLRVILALLDEDNSQQFSSELWDWWNMVSPLVVKARHGSLIVLSSPISAGHSGRDQQHDRPTITQCRRLTS